MRYWYFLLLFVPLVVPLVAVAKGEPTIVILGDSLSAGYGINPQQGWVSLLQDRLQQEGYRYRVINASISGDTSRGGLARLDALLQSHTPAVLIVELGGNDGLRGLTLEEIRGNFAKIIQRGRAAHAKVLLIPMRLPPNYGPIYTQRFAKIYEDLSVTYSVASSHFLLQGIYDKPAMMQPDGIHPRAEAQRSMLGNVWPSLVGLLSRAQAAKVAPNCCQ